MKIQFRKTKELPCVSVPSKTATKLWEEVRGKVVEAKRERRKCGCGGKRYLLLDKSVRLLRDKIGKRYGHPNSNYQFCEHVVLKEIR